MSELVSDELLVLTGQIASGDSGHAPARQTYKRAGFELFPAARYFKKL